MRSDKFGRALTIGSLLCGLVVPLGVTAVIVSTPFRYTTVSLLPALPEHRGEGMALGDFNSDGVPDIAMGLQVVGFVWHPGTGTGSFGPREFIDQGQTPTEVHAVDLNGDAFLDLLAGYYYGEGKVVIWAGDGRGHFRKAAEHAVNGGVVSLAVADFDRDGGLDIAALYQRGRRYFARILWHQRAEPDWKPGEEFEGLGALGAITAGDFDGDGWPDLAVSHSIDSRESPWPTVSVYWNDRGTFHPAEPLTIPVDYPENPLPFLDGFPLNLPRKNADFDGDGVEDLAVPATCPLVGLTPRPGSNRSDFGLLGGTTGGTHRAEQLTPFATSTGAFLPPALVSFEQAEPWACGYLMFIKGDRSRALSVAGRVPTGNWPQSAQVRDLDGDGYQDVAVGGVTALGVLFGRGDFSFESQFHHHGNLPNAQVESSDLNGDGLLDLVQGTTHYMLIVPAIAPRRYPVPVGMTVTSGHLGQPGFALCDLDGDTVKDVIMTDGLDRVWSFFNRPQERGFVGPLLSSVEVPPWQLSFRLLLATDIDRDGHCDLLVQVWISASVELPLTVANLAVIFGGPGGIFGDRAPVYGDVPRAGSGISAPGQLWPGELLRVDLANEFVLLPRIGAELALWRFGADFSPQMAQAFEEKIVDSPVWTRRAGSGWTGLWDVDRDGDLDIATLFWRERNDGNREAAIGAYLRDGDSFAHRATLSASRFPIGLNVPEDPEFSSVGPLGFADVNDDGVVDFLWLAVERASGDAFVTWSRGLTDFQFAAPEKLGPALPYGLGTGIGEVELGDPFVTVELVDVTGDGHRDLVFLNAGVLAVMPGLGNGKFGVPSLHTLLLTSADHLGFGELVDLDLDGRLDVLASLPVGPFPPLDNQTPAPIWDESRQILLQADAAFTVFTIYNFSSLPPVFTPTPTRTRGIPPSWTPYRTVEFYWTPTATPRPSSPTPRPIGACVGDCNGDGRVTVDEIVRGVKMALNELVIEPGCGFDRDGNDAITVDELVVGITSLLRGCS